MEVYIYLYSVCMYVWIYEVLLRIRLKESLLFMVVQTKPKQGYERLKIFFELFLVIFSKLILG